MTLDRLRAHIGWTVAAFMALAGAVLPGTSVTQEAWPQRTIRMVVAYLPGGSTDTAARMLVEALSRRLGQ